MRSGIQSLFVALALSWGCGCSTTYAQTAIGIPEHSVAPGFVFEPIAGAPLTKWPVLVDWDSQGHLLVVESGGVAHPIVEHNRQLLHRIVRLIDDNGDGVMDRRELVAEGLPFIEGVLSLGARLLISCPPVIYQLYDSEGDGFYEGREVWFDGQTITGCANDLHGPYLGRDGWVYWCKGAFAEQKHELLSGGILKDKAAHIYRRRITGGAIEPVMSGGMDNPVGFAMLPNGERFFSSTFLVHPGDGMRDGVVHAIYGGTYGKEHSALDGVVRTGPLMPIMIHLGPAAPSGLICLRGALGSDSEQDTLLVALFNHRKLTALPLQPMGTTYQTRPMDLVVGNRIDFHPTDVIEDMDGSLIVVDTGGWYDLCCPSSRVDQELAAGGIYRLKKTDTPSGSNSQVRQDVARSYSADVGESAEKIVELLDDSRPWVSRSALLKVIENDDWAIQALFSRIESPQASHVSRRNAFWALGAIGSSKALEFISRFWNVPKNDGVSPQKFCSRSELMELQHIACHLVSLYRHCPAKGELERFFSDVAWHDQRVEDSEPIMPPISLVRAALEGLGRIGDEETIPLLFAAIENFGYDRILEHSIRYALFEIGNAEAVAGFLDSPSPSQRELALFVLDLLKSEQLLTAARLVKAAQNFDTGKTATRLLVDRPVLAGEVLDLLGSQWVRELPQSPPPELFRQLVLGWRHGAELEQWIGANLGDMLGKARSSGQDLNSHQWQWIESVLGSRNGMSIPVHWHGWILDALPLSPLRMTTWISGLNLQGKEHLPLVNSMMSLIAEEPDLAAKEALLRCLPPTHLYENDTLAERQIAKLQQRSEQMIGADVEGTSPWRLLKRLKIGPEMGGRLLDLHPQLQNHELLSLIEIVTSVRSEELDRKLLNELSQNRAARGLPAGSLVNAFRNRSEAVRIIAQEVADKLSQSDPDVNAQVQSILAELPTGDPVRGLSIYHGTKVNCGGCHQMGYLGGKIGPELTRIGASRTREALLEAILFPNARIEQGFQSTQVLTSDGQIFNGIPTSNSNQQQLELRISPDRTEIIDTRDIEVARPSDVSIMPGGMLEQLSRQDLADLLSLLEAAK